MKAPDSTPPDLLAEAEKLTAKLKDVFSLHADSTGFACYVIIGQLVERVRRAEGEVSRLRGGFAPPCERCEDGQPIVGRVVTLCEPCFEHLSV